MHLLFDFNSIKVQLERLLASLILAFLIYFNSIKVQLEHRLQRFLNFSQRHFNSIKVQLEPIQALPILTLVMYFNSIKVQLEPKFVGKKARFSTLFQFHKGTIRT